MKRGRTARTAALAMLLWFALSLVLWALRPYKESVEIGTDYTASPPGPASVVVRCTAPLAGASLRGKLPELTPQPADKPKLALTRVPCNESRKRSRILMGIDAGTFLGFFAWYFKPQKRTTSA